MPEHTHHSPPKDVPDYVGWATLKAAQDAQMVWDKAGEYGNLMWYGDAIHHVTGYEGFPDSKLSIERAVASLVALKLGRIMSALSRGKLPSEDSWRDITCYAMMARRIRLTGTWPA